ncbi:hypothetical protein [Sphingomonas carotinifaciens]|uniref:hypothetical protein n=1 Tax=Sphingomonas carotinifaciens TaxID=1166323 RepID=UPI00180F2491|nr:hypothetical protein [Sphingomonas carotinifaciens]MBB4086759.1 hypothetical protein [Sphingomonas carotinifaciens]
MRIFGPPDFIHIGWDRWAKMEIMPGDVAIFATGEAEDHPSDHSFPDICELP